MEDIIGNVQSIQLKDGTIIVVNQEEKVQEGIVDEQAQLAEVEGQDQSNQLRARPMIGKFGPVAPRMPMVRPVAAPLRPLKPMVAPRGPVKRGYPVYPPSVNPYLTPKPVIPPKVPSVARPGMMVPQPVVKPLLNQVIQAPNVMPGTTVFRTRPGQENENNFQEEEYNGEEYCEYDAQPQDENAEVELRARPPFGAPLYRPVPVVPRVLPRPVAPIPPIFHKRGPMPRVPLVGYNTFQPRVFRARPRGIIAPIPMFTPLNATFQPKSYGFGRPLSHHPGRRGYMPPPPMRVFRARPRSNSYDGQEDTQNLENQNQINTEGNECGTSVCTRCGKEF